MQKQEESLINILYRFESWTIKKAEHPRIDAFKLWCWRRLLRVTWTARRSNQSILKEINPEYSWERLMLKLKLQYCGHLMGQANTLENILMLGKIEGKTRRGRQRMWWLDGITDSVDMSLSKPREIVKDRGAWHATVWDHKESDMTWQLNKNNKNFNYFIWSPSLTTKSKNHLPWKLASS